jgi:hypothetical protein
VRRRLWPSVTSWYGLGGGLYAVDYVNADLADAEDPRGDAVGSCASAHVLCDGLGLGVAHDLGPLGLRQRLGDGCLIVRCGIS